jgi:hypothetical protein
MLKTTLLKSAVISTLACGSLTDPQAVMFNRFTCKNPDTAILAVLQDSNKGIPNCLKAAYESQVLHKARDQIQEKYSGFLANLFVERALDMLGLHTSNKNHLGIKFLNKFYSLLTPEEKLGILRGFLASNPSPSKEYYESLRDCVLPKGAVLLLDKFTALQDKLDSATTASDVYTNRKQTIPESLSNEIKQLEHEISELEKEADKILAHHSRLPSLAAGAPKPKVNK